MAFPDLPSKPLPPPAKDERLPSIPPLDFDRPAPPPKIVHDLAPEQPPPPPHKPLAPIDVKASLAASDLSLGSAPLTPLTPAPGALPPAPSSPSVDGKAKKSNPLTDLIDTEKVYVDLLTGIIRKIAAAWSRSNLPPPELDTMFRSVESIYKANRQLLGKLKEIGTNPKGLGDLLMKWIDDLDGPYTNYCSKFCSGFDTWEPVQSNSRVRTNLAMFSSSNPPPLPTSSPAHPAEPPIWTLDELFLLPKGRLKYYKKLYSRLLKSTSPGRSDHRMLSGALEKLDRLLATLDSRAQIRVGGSTPKEEALPPIETEDEVVIDMRARQSTLEPQPRVPPSQPTSPSQRASDSTRASGSLSSSGRRSEDTAPTTDSRTSTSTLSMPITDLERRLSTERTLDIFSMKPKQVRLQIAPPNLHYTRELRCSTSVVISFTPRSTGVELVQERGHVFLLTDLMLVCEKMTPKEMEAAGRDGPDMWLSYPPLAGKHLRVAPVDDFSISVTILRKETLIMRTDSRASRDRLIADFKDCIETASTLFPSSSKNAPPPVPALPSMQSNMGNSMSRPPSVPLDRSHPPSMADVSVDRFSDSMSPERAMSPASSHSRRSNDPPSRVSSAGAALADAALSGDMGRMNIGGPGQPQSPVGPAQQGFPPRSTSAASGLGGPGFGPGQMMPPGGFAPGQVMPPRPGQMMPPGGYGPGQVMPQQAFGPGQTMPPGPGGPMGRPPPSSFNAPGGPGMPPQRNPSFGHGPPNGGPPQGGPGMPPQRNPSFGHGPPPNGGPGPQRQPSLNGPAPGGPGMPPPQRQGSFNNGPPQVGQSYQGMPPRPPQQGMGMGMPPDGRSGMGPMGPGGFGGPGPAYPPPRPPSEPTMDGLRKMPSNRSLGGHQPPMHGGPAPPMPGYPGDFAPPQPMFLQRNGSSSSLPNLASGGGLHAPQPRPLLPSAQLSMRSVSTAGSFSIEDPSPPGSPVEETPRPTGPVTSVVSAQMKCKVFLKQHHAQWKSLGSARLRLYREDPTNIKQLVVEADNKGKTVLISTIVLTDGVERVGKTGIAIELSDKGLRTGVVYMLQLRNEKSAGGLFDELLVGSDRHGR
ncbi:hypothetical protein L227DRAFT_650102 [Lentinus tigrinus ALCF2SS1-6]|uniref:DH domain-containing protein n=1 Tax=Lentinus tigrinus ALCF2SS1-6 TaxID=1328759 RepID=A0A5C2SUK7_9APHY|nr:hypothetical protein L227DRAFT_650102 [Lentinus tigrinus ALCF2SS1-6]